MKGISKERIRVLVATDPCSNCKLKPCTRKCMFRTLFEKAPGMTRHEAVSIMARAFNSVVTIISKDACLEGTEVALNALLENTK